MELEDFMLMQKGFFAMRKADDLRFAKSAFWPYAIGENIRGSSAYMSKFISQWFGEKPKELNKEELKMRTEEIMKKIAVMQKIQDEKDKLNPKKPKSSKQVNPKKKNARAA